MSPDDMQEAPRPDPGFRIRVFHHDPASVIDVTDAVMDAYDVAVNCLDFGSGFLSTEEVANLRHLGKAIGAKPLHYKCDYAPEYRHHISGHLMKARPCTCGAFEVAA